MYHKLKIFAQQLSFCDFWLWILCEDKYEYIYGFSLGWTWNLIFEHKYFMIPIATLGILGANCKKRKRLSINALYLFLRQFKHSVEHLGSATMRSECYEPKYMLSIAWFWQKRELPLLDLRKTFNYFIVHIAVCEGNFYFVLGGQLPKRS